MAMKWQPGITIYMDPNSILDYEFDFTAWLDGNTIDTVTAIASGCSVDQPAVDNNVAKFRVHSLIANQGRVTVRILAEDGQRDDFSLRFALRNQ